MKWKNVKLGDTATFINGYPFKPSDWGKEGLPIIRIQNLTKSSNEVNFYNGGIPDKYFVKNGDILISWSASLGVYEWNQGDAWLNQHIFKVVFDKNEIDKCFFKHLISLKIDEMIRATHGATMKHITKGKFDDILVSIPPLPTQLHIASILDKADNLRRLNKQLIAKYDELMQSVFYEMFGDPVRNSMQWETKTVDQVANVLSGYAFKSEEYSSDINDIKICGGLIVYPNYIDWDKANYWPKNKTKGIEKYWLLEGDIIIAMDRPWISSGFKLEMIKRTDPPSLLVQRTARIRCNNIDNHYLHFLLIHQCFKNHCKPTETTVPHISPNEIKSYRIPIPPLKLQTQFANIVSNIETQKSHAQQALMQSEALFQGLLQECFRGEK
jgi:type I restriction enzyme, S subunit